MKIHDITMEIHQNMIVYPGNPKPKIKKTSTIPPNSVNESKIIIGSHSGTHVDSPLHIKKNGASAIKLPLESFYGKCKVIDLTHVEREIHADDLKASPIEADDIVLLKTKNSLEGYKKFNKKFIHIKKIGRAHV